MVLALSSVVVLVAMVLVALASVAVARHRAAAAADLGALAAAAHVLEGRQAACARADDVLRAQGARLVSCAVVGAESVVVAEVRPPGPLGRWGAARERARAGPAADPAPGG